jgi:hypothetical protein
VVKNHFGIVTILIILASLVPMIVTAVRARREGV